MPRAGLTPSAVVDAAIALVDLGGPDALTLTAVADRLSVRAPSLYNHVDGLDDLRARTAARSMGELADALEAAVDDDDPATFLGAYRRWVRAHPSRYALLPAQPTPAGAAPDGPLAAPATRLVDLVVAWAGRFGLDGDDAIHAARAVRSAVHGFCTIESAGGFGLPVDVEQSFSTLAELLLTGLRAQARDAAVSVGRPRDRRSGR